MLPRLFLFGGSAMSSGDHKGLAVSLDVALVKLRAILAALAPLTATKLDDSAIAVIDAILHDGTLFGWFSGKVREDDLHGKLALESQPPVALQAVLEQRQIDWARLLEWLPHIVTLIKILRG